MQPLASRPKALLAAHHCCGGIEDPDLVEMRARVHVDRLSASVVAAADQESGDEARGGGKRERHPE